MAPGSCGLNIPLLRERPDRIPSATACRALSEAERQQVRDVPSSETYREHPPAEAHD
jgi:hypothetical protein